MLRTLRAFAWMRWRVLLNSLERTGSRDVIGRMATAMDQLTPVVLVLVALPSALTLAGLAGYAGWTLGQDGDGGVTFRVLRLVLIAASVLAIAGPFMLPRAGAHAVRLLLLPIPRRVLFIGQFGAGFADPWLVLAAAPLVTLPIGLAAAGQAGAAGVALAGGALLLAILATVALLVTSAIELTMRNRRRGELLALLLFLLMPVAGVLAGLGDGQQREARERPPARIAARRPAPDAIERRVLALVPSESYALAVRDAARGNMTTAVRPLLSLAGGLVLLQGLAFLTFARVLASPGVVGSRAGGGAQPLPGRRLAGLSAGASAVAIGQLRTALRTPRGRFALLSPVLVFTLLALMLLRSPSGVQFGGFFRLETGVGLAALASFIALLSVLPFSMNQFAVDGAGLTLTLLAPLETRTLLAGKAAGNGMVAAIPAAVCTAAALVLFPFAGLTLWACVPLALASTYLVTSPLAAALSIVFPRSVDLNSIGRGSNAHGAAAFLGTLATAAGGGASLLLVLGSTVVLQRPALAPLLLLAWFAICGVTAFLLFQPVATLFDRRREHLSMLR